MVTVDLAFDPGDWLAVQTLQMNWATNGHWQPFGGSFR